MKTKNIWVTIIAIIVILLLIGGGIYMFTGVGKKEMIEVTAYSCDDATNICKVVGGTSQAVIGGVEGASHFSMKVTATPTGEREITNLRIMSDSENPATIINPDPVGTIGVNAFYNSLKNGQTTPTKSGVVSNAYVWDTSICESGACNNRQCFTDSNKGCDLDAGETCKTVGNVKKCLLPASQFLADDPIEYTFTASIKATYKIGELETGKTTNSGSKIIRIAPDPTGGDIFTIDVSEAPI